MNKEQIKEYELKYSDLIKMMEEKPREFKEMWLRLLEDSIYKYDEELIDFLSEKHKGLLN